MPSRVDYFDNFCESYTSVIALLFISLLINASELSHEQSL